MKKKSILTVIFLTILLGNLSFAQNDNVISQYEPYIFSLKKLTFYYPEDDALNLSSRFVIVIRANISGTPDAFIKFLIPDKLAFESFKEFKDGVLQDVSQLDKKGVLIPPVKDIPGKNFLEVNISGYAELTEADFDKIKRISAAEVVPVSTAMIDMFNMAYNNYTFKNEALKPSDEFWAESQAFLAGMNTRKKVDLGWVQMNIPVVTDVKNIKYGENLVSGDKVFEDKTTYMVGIANFKMLKDEEMVYNQDYYKKIMEMFNKLAGASFYADDYFKNIDALNDLKAYSLKDRSNVYLNAGVRKQLTYLLDVLLMSTKIKKDTSNANAGLISLEGQVAYDFFKENLGLEKNRFNKYIYNDYIGDSMNKVKLMRELELIRVYYGLK